MNTKNTSADAGSLQGGYGSPTPEDEMPDLPGTTGDPTGYSGDNEQPVDEKREPLHGRVQDTENARSHQQQGLDPSNDGNSGPHSEDASNDPLLEPLTPADNDAEQVPVSEADLNKARTPEPPD